LAFQYLDLATQEVVAILLIVDHDLEPPVDDGSNSQARQGRHQHHCLEGLAPTLACRFAVRKQIDQNHCRNLRMARPQEVRYEGASRTRFFRRTPLAISMPSNGLAVMHAKPVFLMTCSVRPARGAEPPASMMWSTRW